MESPSASLALTDLSRENIQDIFDEAQLEAGTLYQDAPYLQVQLQDLFREGVEMCNFQGVDWTELLQQSVVSERIFLDAYNKHRLGNAVTAFNKQVLDPENAVEYNEEENVPEQLKFFPLRAAVVKRGVEVRLDPIFQLDGTVEYNQKKTTKVTISKKPAQSSVATNNKAPTQAAKPKKETGFSTSYNKLQDAPSAWLGFPAGNLTFAEVTAFVPQSIKSVDVINRFLFNGAMTTTITDMINHYRTMDHGAINNNSVYRMMKGPINHHAKQNPSYRNWTVAKHERLPKPAGFDSKSVSVAGFTTPVNNNSREVQNAATQAPPTILFRDLANGIEVMPSGYDALDLTRCVEYCVEHDDEDWYYPQQFSELVNHLGGPAPVHRKHQDAACIRRHTDGKKLVNAKRAGARERDDHGRLLKQKGKAVVDSDGEVMGDNLDEDIKETDFGDQDNSDDDTAPPRKSGTKRKRDNVVSLPDEDDEVAGSSLRSSQRKKLKRSAAPSSKNDNEAPGPSLRKSARRKPKVNYVEGSSNKDNEEAGSSLRPSRRNKRKRTSQSSDEKHEAAGFSKLQSAPRKKKALPKSRVPRVTKPVPSRLRNSFVPDDTDSDDSDVYIGPKQKKRANVATRASSRTKRYKSSYNIDAALKVVDEEEEDESEDEETAGV